MSFELIVYEAHLGRQVPYHRMVEKPAVFDSPQG
jgi:hypothetical protein